MLTLDNLMSAMIEYFNHDPKRIHHFIKVFGFAQMIGKAENLDEKTQFTLEVAALVHDIGIKLSEEKYQSSSGKYQEIEGPAEARMLLESLSYEEELIERVSWLIGHHHTYNDVVGLDYQILIEADFLVNAYEDQMSTSAIQSVKEKIFKTATGIKYVEQIYE